MKDDQDWTKGYEYIFPYKYKPANSNATTVDEDTIYAFTKEGELVSIKQDK